MIVYTSNEGASKMSTENINYKNILKNTGYIEDINLENVDLLGAISGGADGEGHADTALAGEAGNSTGIEASALGEVLEAAARCSAAARRRC